MTDLAQISTLVFDVDGVFTDATVLVSEDGQLLRSMSIRDGLAVKLALDAGLRVAVITGGRSEGVRVRFKNLGVEDYYSGVQDKLPVLRGYLERHGISTTNVLYCGDDLPDIPAMRVAGLSYAPADAATEVLEQADVVCARAGGQHCVREIVEAVLKAQARWAQA